MTFIDGKLAAHSRVTPDEHLTRLRLLAPFELVEFWLVHSASVPADGVGPPPA